MTLHGAGPPQRPGNFENKASIYTTEHECGEPAEAEPAFSEDYSAVTSERLTVPKGDRIRASSPESLSILSLEDHRTGRSLLSAPGPSYRYASRSPGPPRTWRGKLEAFWIRNKGLALVLAAQVFGTLMNVTTRLLEIEGNNGKGMHPFQVSSLILKSF